MIKLRNLLPKVLEQQRWGDLVEASQNTSDNYVKNDIIEEIKYRQDKTLYSTDKLINFIESTGFSVNQGEGYTGTDEYLIKLHETIVPRILTKSAYKTYLYILYLFNLVGDVYPLLADTGNLLIPYINWLETPELTENEATLDAGIQFTLDMDETDPEAYIYLDQNNIESLVTRHLVIKYEPLVAENTNEFLSSDTNKIFLQNVNSFKTNVVIPHFQYVLEVNGTTGNQIYETSYNDYTNESIIAKQETLLMHETLKYATKIQFGDSPFSNITNSISGVNNLLFEFNFNEVLPHITSITFIDDVAGNTDGTYFYIDSTEGNFYVWYNVDSGGNDPMVQSRIPIQVDITTGELAASIASATQTAINTIFPDEFNFLLAGNQLIMEFKDIDIYDNIQNVDTLFTFNLDQQVQPGLLLDQQTDSLVVTEQNIYTKTKFFNFNEIALLDNMDECILYSKFPEVNFDLKMYNSIYLNINRIAQFFSSISSWTINESYTNEEWWDTIYGKDKFITVGNGGLIKSSLDGINWNSETSPDATTQWFSVTYGQGLYVACAFSYSFQDNVMTSLDGISWGIVDTGIFLSCRDIAYDNINDKFIIVGSHGGVGKVMYSSDGTSWSVGSSVTQTDWQYVATGNGITIATNSTASGNQAMMSSDGGITWSTVIQDSGNFLYDVAYGNNLFIITSTNDLYVSSDGVSWDIVPSPIPIGNSRITYGNGLFIVLTSNGTYIYSQDGLTWKNSNTGQTFDNVIRLSYGNGLFIATSISNPPNNETSMYTRGIFP